MTAIDISAQLRRNDPTTLQVVTNSNQRLPGGQVLVAGVPTTLTKAPGRSLRWRQVSKAVRALDAAGVLAPTADAPTIDSITSTIENDNTAVVTILGTGFEVSANVFLVDADGAQIAVGNKIRVSATELTFTVPTTVEPGVYGVRVTDAELVITEAAALTVTEA